MPVVEPEPRCTNEYCPVICVLAERERREERRGKEGGQPQHSKHCGGVSGTNGKKKKKKKEKNKERAVEGIGSKLRYYQMLMN